MLIKSQKLLTNRNCLNFLMFLHGANLSIIILQFNIHGRNITIYECYFPFLLGDNNVTVSVFTEETKNNVNNFGLRARPPGDTRCSIMCEKGKVLTNKNYCVHPWFLIGNTYKVHP